MTGPARLWPDSYTAALVRRYSPGVLAQVAAWIVAQVARLGAVLAPPVLMVPAASYRPAGVLVQPGPAVAWSAPHGADSMTTGPPPAARGNLPERARLMT